jgi:hypothetical protein
MVIRKGFLIALLSIIVSSSIVTTQDLKVDTYHFYQLDEGKIEFNQ